MAENKESKKYRLGDGIILSIGPVQTQLVGLEQDFEVPIDYRFVSSVEKLTLHGMVDESTPFLDRLLQEKVVVEGQAGPDPVIEKKLRTLDEPFFSSYRHTLSRKALDAYALLVAAHSRRKRFYERVGQCPILPEAALRRALLVGDAEEVGALEVLCVGDDDLVSIALAALGHRVTVFDIDDYLIQFLGNTARDLNLDIRVKAQDLRDPIEDETLESFDCFLTDPMSNRDCFEIFLSRAFSLLKTGGTGFTAVYAPVGRLFKEIQKEMGFEIDRWMSRHNRYYSRYFKLHNYESDWVQMRKTSATTPKVAPDEFSVPLNLYREDHHQRPKSYLLLLNGIEDVHLAKPLFLDIIFDGVQNLEYSELAERISTLGQDWTFIHAPHDEGYINLHVDRPRKQIVLDMHPFQPKLERPLRELLMAAYKTTGESSEVSIGRAGWHLRID